MMDGRSGGGAGGGGSFDPSALAGYATQAWTEENYISKTFFNELFIVHKKVTTVVMDGETEISRTVTTNTVFAPNEIPGTTTETDEETGYVTTVTTEIASIESKKGFWTNYFLSALGLNSEGGGGGLTLNEPLATINVSGLADHPSSSGQTIVWNGSAWVYGTAGGGTGTVTGVKVGNITYSPVNGIVSIPAYPTSLAWSAITGKPTTIAGYGITDAKIENGVITLGSNTITPLTSSAITDMATKTWVGNNYLPLTGGTLSISSIGGFTIKNTTSNYPLIRFEGNTGGGLGFIGFGKTGSVVAPYYVTADANGGYTDGVSQWHFLLHSGNYTDYTYSKSYIDTELAKKLDVAFFDALFQAYAGSTKVTPNASTSSVDNIKAMFGFWTQQYISALGKNDSGGEIVLNEPLASINDAGLAAHPSSSGQTIVWNGSAWTYGTAGGSGMTYTFATGDANGQFKVTPSSGAAYNVSIKGLAALAYKASLAVSDIPDLSGMYLPLTGGTITGNIGIRSPHDLSATNNGVESGAIWRGYYIYDKDSRLSAQFVNGVYSSGSNFVWMGVRNYNTEGTQVADYGIGLSVDKSGNASYTVSQPAAFRTAIDALSKTEINGYTWWGRALSNGVVNGDMTNVGNISFSASGKNIGGLMSFVTAGNGTVGVGTLSPNTNYKLDVNGYTKTSRLYLSDTIYMVVQNDGIHIVGGGLYADTYVSAFGLSDSSSPAFDEQAMWQALAGSGNEQINGNHLTTALAPYALTSQIPTSLKNPYKLTITLNGTPTEYDGSAARSLTINTGLDQQALTTYLSTKILTVKNGTATLGTWNPTAAGTIDIASALSGYLPLKGGSLTGNLNIVYSHDLSKSNNGVSDTLWPGYRINDKYGRRSAQFVNGVYSSGSNFVWMGVSNYDTSGNMIADYGIGLSVDKNGAGTWSVSEPAAFRTAIGIPALLGGYLPLSGGTMTGILKVATGKGIEDATGNGLLVYHPTNWNGVSASQWGAGAVDCQGVIRSNASDLKHYRGNALYNILDSYNSGISDGKVTINGTTLEVSSSYNLPTPGTFTSGYWHRLGNYVTAGDGNNIVITIYDGTGYNAQAEQNSIARIVIKDGWQSTRAAANSVGTSIERFAYFFDLRVSIVATEHNAGEVWVYLPWQYAQGTYTVSGRYTSWLHHDGIDGDTTTEPVTNQTLNSASSHSYLYYDYACLTSNVASATRLQSTRYIWGNAFDGTADINGNLIMPNNRGIVIKDTNGVEQNVFVYNQNNDVVIGWGPRSTSDTYITGNTISIARNGGANGFYLNTSNNIGLGGAGDSSHKLYVQGSTLLKHSGGESLTLDTTTTYNCIVYQINAASKWSVGTDANGTFYWYTQPGGNNTVMSLTSAGILNVSNSVKCTDLWIGNIHITYDSTNGGIHVANGGLSANTYVSALGVGQEGGGSQGLDIEAMWTELATPNSARQIDSSHISSALSNYVTTNTLSSYATQQWVNQQGFVKTSGVTSVAMSVPSSLRVNTGSGATITTSGTFAITLASGYSIPTTAQQSNWDTAYGWGNHATAGYSTPQGVATQMLSYAYISGNVIHIGDNSITPLTSHQSVDGTFWGRSWSNHGTVSGDMSSVGDISFSASGKNIGSLLYFDTSTPQLKVNTSSTGSYTHGYSTIYPKLYVSGELGVSGGLWAGFNELYYSTPYIDFHYDYSQADYTTRLIESEAGILSILSPNIAGLLVGGYNGDYVQIGQIRIVYESSNNALRIENANNGGAANLYAMGGISALGMSGNADGTISGSLIPSTSKTYTLGNSSYRWKYLYLSYGSDNFSIEPGGGQVAFNTNTGFYFNSDTEIGGDLYVNDHLGVGDTDTSYALYVYGNAKITGGLSYNSDMRLKDFLANKDIDVENIARAPLFDFRWKDTHIDNDIHIGTSAQYWRGVLSETVNADSAGMLSLDYGVTALAGVISVARKVMTHEEEIAALKRRIGELENEIETLKAA